MAKPHGAHDIKQNTETIGGGETEPGLCLKVTYFRLSCTKGRFTTLGCWKVCRGRGGVVMGHLVYSYYHQP